MVGSYLKANERHEGFRDLLERKSLNNESLTREELNNTRDNLMLLLTIRNIKRSRRHASFEVEIESPLLCPTDMVDLRWQSIRLRCRESRHRLWQQESFSS